jgi:hypothetical protein
MADQAEYKEFGRELREMGARDDSSYGNVGVFDHLFNIPAQAFKGRAGTRGKTFAGYYDQEQGFIRVDCAEDPCFWLEIDMTRIPALAAALAAAPGGPAAQAAAAEFEEAAKRQCQEWKPATPRWLRTALEGKPELRKAVEECVGDQAHPGDMSMFPEANALIEGLTWEELEALVEQGGL